MLDHHLPGLGLLTAKAIIEQAGGQLALSNVPDGLGALVRVHLPKLDTPAWFYDITRTNADAVLALDDDATMGQQLATLFPNKAIATFQDEKAFLQASMSNISALPLVDYDFGGSRNGLDLIIHEKLGSRAVLLSGRIAFDPKIRAMAEANGVRMFPKECLS